MIILGHLLGALFAALDEQHQRDKKNPERQQRGQAPDHTSNPRPDTSQESSTRRHQNRRR